MTLYQCRFITYFRLCVTRKCRRTLRKRWLKHRGMRLRILQNKSWRAAGAWEANGGKQWICCCCSCSCFCCFRFCCFCFCFCCSCFCCSCCSYCSCLCCCCWSKVFGTQGLAALVSVNCAFGRRPLTLDMWCWCFNVRVQYVYIVCVRVACLFLCVHVYLKVSIDLGYMCMCTYLHSQKITWNCTLFLRSPNMNLWDGLKWTLFPRKSCN